LAKKTIVVVGGALSGPTAAARARETDEKARIILIERNRDVSYAVGALAYHLSGEVPSVAALNQQRAEFFRDVYDIEVRSRIAATTLDAKKRRLTVDGDTIPYTSLVYATGAGSSIPPDVGLDGADNVTFMRTIVDLERIDGHLAQGARRIVVIGGGYIGIEASDGLLRRGMNVAIIERAPYLLPRFSEAPSREAAREFERRGARVFVQDEVVSTERTGNRVTALRLRGGERLEADLVIVATGVKPRTELLRAAGAKLLPDGTVLINDNCQTSLPGVFACGICVSVRHAVSRKPTWFAQAALADKTAQVAGACATGARVRLGPMLGTAIVRVGELALARTGLTFEEAQAYTKKQAQVTRVHAPSIDSFFPGSAPVSLMLVHHKKTGRLLGAEALGRHGVDKRIDVLATAILGGLDVKALGMLDLAYTPPFSAARDPVNVVGTVATGALSGAVSGLEPAAVAAAGARFTLVDVRQDADHARGTIPGALGLPLESLRERITTLRGRGPVVFFCDNGRRGYLATRIARQRGLRTASYLSGGLVSWRQEGRPLTTGGGAS
jgi:NADPH-dependent 2,4-dienoyl-CoA reductase/sulfur reductase-like enzyme/rhodanese-related sulfurtransferase